MALRNRTACSISQVMAEGLGSFVLGAAPTGFKPFGIADQGVTFTILIIATDGLTWEIRRNCSYVEASKTLSRGDLEESSNADNSPVVFTAGAFASVSFSAQDAVALIN